MNDDLQSFIEPELEARLVALILGEASAFEEEELDRIIKERPEVALAKQRLEEVHGLIGQSMALPDDDDEWKLSSERREKVLAVLGEDSSADEEQSQRKERRISIAQWRSIYATAACLMVAVVVLALVVPMSDQQKLGEPSELLSYSAEESENMATREDSMAGFDTAAISPAVRDEESLYRQSQARLSGLIQDRDFLKSEMKRLENESIVSLKAKKGGVPENKVPDRFAKMRSAGKSANVEKERSLSLDADANRSVREALNTRLSVLEANIDQKKQIVQQLEEQAEGGRNRELYGAWIAPDDRAKAAKDQLAAIDAGLGDSVLSEPSSGPSGIANQRSFGINGIPEGVVQWDWAVSSQSYSTANTDPESGKPVRSEDRLWFSDGEKVSKDWNEFIDGEREFSQLAEKGKSLSRLSESGKANETLAKNKSTHWHVDNFASAPDDFLDVELEPQSRSRVRKSKVPAETKASAGVRAVVSNTAAPKFVAPEPSADFGDEFGVEFEGGAGTSGEIVARKPAAPASSFAAKIPESPADSFSGVASANVSESKEEMPGQSADKGRQNDFGYYSGLNEKIVDENSSGDLVGQEMIRRQEAVRSADTLLVEGRDLYAQGDYESAVKKYQASIDTLPFGSATSERRDVIKQHLKDGGMALSQQFRRAGKYDEARSLLTEMEAADPGNEEARKSLEYLDDPIRANPSASHANTKSVDKIRRNLYKGNGYYDLGLYDKAEEEFKEVLRTDPYNKAARRWLEKTNAIKSDYYRAAYDETRSRMLMEVDKAWESAVPPLEGSEKNAPDLTLTDESQSESNGIVTRRIKIPAGFEDFLSSDLAERNSDADPFASDDSGGASGIKARRSIRDLLRDQGVPFPEGATASLLTGSGELIVRNTPENMELVEKMKEIVEESIEESKPRKVAGSRFEFQRKTAEGQALLGEDPSNLEAVPLYAVDGVVSGDDTVSKFHSIILPELDLKNATVEEAMAVLEQGALANDVEGKGLQMDVRKPLVAGGGFDDDLDGESGLLGDVADPGKVTIDQLYLTNVPLSVAAQYVADKAKLRYKIDGGKVTFLPLTNDVVDDIVTRRWKVPAIFNEFIDSSGLDDPSDPFATGDEDKKGEKEIPPSVFENLKLKGVSFIEGTSASYLPGSGTLVVRNTPTQLELIDAIVQASVKEEKGRKAAEEAKALAAEQRLNFETLTTEKTDSTFSLNVSDVSFKLAKSSLAEGKWPEATKVRPEEFVNALDYDDRKPSQSEKVACEIEQGAHPFMQQRNLMRVSMSTAALGRNASTPLRLTILLDQSGSMERADRAESVMRAFGLLTAQLNAGDEVTLVGFARTPRLLAERVKGNESGKLLEIVSRPLTEGGTNLEGALASGIQLAKQQYLEGAQNRIILLTDGAANLGDALPANLAKQVEQMRQSDIAFDACGVGADGLNDEILTSLTKQGDGRYYFLDRPEDADEGFARQIAGALRPAAKNVKVQVIFNPKRVSKFKLYGFEKHLLNKEDFRNDSVDAAEMAAEESGVALYHFEALPGGEGDVGHVSVRFLDTATDRMVERTWPIPYEENVTGFSSADPALRLAGTAALFAERLKDSAVGERVDLKQLRKESDALQGTYSNQPRFQELRTMLQQAGE